MAKRPGATKAQLARTADDWRELADHFIADYFPTLGPFDVVSKEELCDCVAEAMEASLAYELPSEARGNWVAIEDVKMGDRVVAPFNKGVGYMVGTVKMCPYGSGKRVVSNGESFVTPEAVKMLLQAVDV